MYEIVINSNKTITLNEKQFAFLELIGQLGFSNFNQLTLLWSIVNRTYVSFSHSMLRRWINNYHLLKKYPVIPSQKIHSSNLSRPVYHLSSFGVRALKSNNIDYIPLEQLNCNSHNEECNEVTIQALFQAAFDVDLVNNSQLKPINQNLKNIVASSEFDLSKLDLRPFSKQVDNYKIYPFIPDQMINFTHSGQKCEVMIELDNRTENDNIQMKKIFNYIKYAYQHPQTQIMMVIAITDGSLPTYRVPKYSMPYLKVNNLLSKFKTYIIEYHGQKYSLVDLYRRVPNLTITIAGVKEAHVDIADFINDKNCISFSIAELKLLANILTKKYKHKVVFQTNKKIDLDRSNYLNIQGKTIGYMIYNPNPIIYQPIKIGYEHTLDTYLDLNSCIPKNYIYCFPTRSRKLLVPAISDYYQRNPGQPIFSQKQGMIFQPILEDNINPKWLLQLLFAREHYYKYLYNFFTSGTIAASNTAHYEKLTYVNSRAYRIVNLYLQQAHVQLNNNSPRPYQTLHNIAIKTNSAKEFAKQLNPQDIPLEVINSIFRQIPIKAFSSPYYPTSSSHTSLVPSNYLYLPNHPDPKKRIKIAF